MSIVVRKPATNTTAGSSDFTSAAAPGLDDSAKGTRQASGLVTVAKALPSSGIDGTDFTTDDRPSTQSGGIVFGRTGIGKTTFVCSYACRRDEAQPGRELVGASPLALINLDGRSKYAVDDARARIVLVVEGDAERVQITGQQFLRGCVLLLVLLANFAEFLKAQVVFFHSSKLIFDLKPACRERIA